MFLLKAVTIVVALLVAFGGIIGLSVKPKSEKGELEIVSISEKLEEQELKSKEFVYSKDEFKAWEKQKKKAHKEKAEQEKQKKEKQKKEKQDQGGNQDTDPKLFVLDFDGSIDAKEVQGLREEITALLLIAKDNDEVLVRLEITILCSKLFLEICRA